MKWLMSRVPLAIVNKAHTARQMYPYAISLIENVGTYKRICERVNERKTCQLLVAGMKKDIQNLILDMSTLVWDSYKLESSVQKFSDSIYNFREKVDELIGVESNIDMQLKELDTCGYSEPKFAEILYEIQKNIDYLNLKGFSNLPQWVSKLDEEVERKFAQRLTFAIKVHVIHVFRLDEQLGNDNNNNSTIMTELIHQLRKLGSTITCQKRIKYSSWRVEERDKKKKIVYESLMNESFIDLVLHQRVITRLTESRPAWTLPMPSQTTVQIVGTEPHVATTSVTCT